MDRKFKSFVGLAVGPIENDPDKRERAIKDNALVKFEIERNPNRDFGSKMWDDLRTFDFFGQASCS